MFCIHDNALGLFQLDNVLWFQENSSEFGALPFSTMSPDLTVLKHIWHALQYATECRNQKPCNTIGKVNKIFCIKAPTIM